MDRTMAYNMTSYRKTRINVEYDLQRVGIQPCRSHTPWMLSFHLHLFICIHTYSHSLSALTRKGIQLPTASVDYDLQWVGMLSLDTCLIRSAFCLLGTSQLLNVIVCFYLFYLRSHLFTFPFSFKEKGNSLIYSIVVYLCISQYLEIGLNFDFEFIFMNCLLITFICMIWTFRTTKSQYTLLIYPYFMCTSFNLALRIFSHHEALFPFNFSLFLVLK